MSKILQSPAEVLQCLRAICGALPEVSERISHGAPTWFVRGKKSFATAWPDGHHDDTFPHLWCAAAPGVQEALTSCRPETFFRPPYVGHRGWLAIRLDCRLAWDELANLLTNAYCIVAPKVLTTLLGESSSNGPRTIEAEGARVARTLLVLSAAVQDVSDCQSS